MTCAAWNYIIKYTGHVYVISCTISQTHTSLVFYDNILEIHIHTQTHTNSTPSHYHSIVSYISTYYCYVSTVNILFKDKTGIE